MKERKILCPDPVEEEAEEALAAALAAVASEEAPAEALVAAREAASEVITADPRIITIIITAASGASTDRDITATDTAEAASAVCSVCLSLRSSLS